MRSITILSFILLAILPGCAGKQLSDKEVAKLKGGKTKVVAYGFCIPMDHLIKTAMTRHTMTYLVNGKPVGKMKTCSYATFRVPSGYWKSRFVSDSFPLGGHYLPRMIFRPGKTQYLYIWPSGNGTFSGEWVSKAEADKGIADIKKIGQLF